VASLVNDGQVAESLLDFSAAGLPSGSYHWRLRAFDNAGASSNWVVFDPATVHFTTDFAPPTIPSGPFSPDGVQLIFLAPTGDVPFSWGPSTDVGPPGPIGYRLEISLSSAFNATVYDAVLTAQDATVNLTAADTPYFWRVSAVDQAGNLSAPSTTAVFQLSWTTPFSEGEDRHANCGATTGGGSPLTLCLAVTAALLGLLLMRRPAA